MDSSDPGLFGPGSITWKIHGEPASLVGGLRALLIQALHPTAMAAVSDYSNFRDNPWERFRRTSEYLGITIFGTTEEAETIARRVRALHKRVSGVDPATGRSYRADDPDLLLWVHAVEVHSFLTAYRRYAGRLNDEEADRYVAEMVRSAELIGLAAEDVPADLDSLRTYLRGVPLMLTPPAREGMRLILAPPMPLPLRPLWSLPAAAAIAILPKRVRKLYGLPWTRAVDPGLRISTFALARAFKLLAPPPPHIRRARRLMSEAG